MELYHVLSRGVDKRKIFLDDHDRLRFVHDLFEFNNEDRANTVFYSFTKTKKSNDIASRKFKPERKPRKLLVDIHAFCILPNHYHLFLSPRVECGVSRFMKKVNMGYAKYFNIKYARKGTLFEGRFKSILVSREAHFIHLPYYIHLNSLDLIAPEWRERKLMNLDKALNFLETYRWSSHLDYCGKKNFPSVTNRDFLLEFFGGSEKYSKSVVEWLEHLDLDIEDLHGVMLEE